MNLGLLQTVQKTSLWMSLADDKVDKDGIDGYCVGNLWPQDASVFTNVTVDTPLFRVT